MSCKRIIQIANSANLGASSGVGTYIFNLPIGLRYARLDLVYVDGGGAPIDISRDATTDFGAATGLLADVELLANSRSMRLHAACELDHLNTLNGTIYGRGAQKTGAGATLRQTLPIYFREPWRKDLAQADSGAFNADPSWGVNSFQLKLTLGAAIPATGSFLILAYVDGVLANPNSGNKQTVKRVFRYDLPAGGTASDFTTINPGNIETVCLINPTGAYVQKVTVKLNGTLFRDAVLQGDNIAGMVGEGMNPCTSQTAAHFGYDIVFDYDDPFSSTLPAVTPGSFWMHLDFSAAASGATRALVETFGAID